MPVARSGPADNKVLWLVLGVVAAVAVIVILVVSLGGDDDPSETGSGDGGGGGGAEGYTAEVEQDFIAACVGQAGEAGRASCQCTYEQLEANVPFERFTELESELASSDADDELPQELLDAVTACA